MKEKLDARSLIQRNAQTICELHQRVHETCKLRDTSPQAKAEWSRACDDFHAPYDALAFPGGYGAGLQKLRAGAADAIEDALVFLEVSPYFFRSQYMRTKFLRLMKHAPLTARQAGRFEKVLEFERERKEHSKRRHTQLYNAAELRNEFGERAQ